ncbi:hypothetical protein IGI04_005646 [Brassica rapa subsp. trilocularis]|uniref:RRM domain-containing protein n=1 Tax=Brassica rapa subsp. trilocularis TaxID=1813537 RepID=A0ABQ7NEK6_BRACM|nr:hypothetical protein IGI04_005646 [Brassica rapa subsp. trilocularis]
MSLPNDIETKIYVAGLPWITKTESLRNYFEQFGEIVYANVVCDRATKRSKGFGFITFKEAESANRACEDPNPTIDGRKTSCKLAYLGARVHNNQSNENGTSIIATGSIISSITNITLGLASIRIKRNLNHEIHRASCSVTLS